MLSYVIGKLQNFSWREKMRFNHVEKEIRKINDLIGGFDGY